MTKDPKDSPSTPPESPQDAVESTSTPKQVPWYGFVIGIICIWILVLVGWTASLSGKAKGHHDFIVNSRVLIETNTVLINGIMEYLENNQ